MNERENQMIPAQLVEQLSTALAQWDGRGPSDDDTLEAVPVRGSAIGVRI